MEGEEGEVVFVCIEDFGGDGEGLFESALREE